MDPREQILDEILVLHCREGNRDAYEKLVARWQDRLWRHAFREPLDMHPAREALEHSVRKFEKRMRTVRFMAILAVTFMGIVAVWMAVIFARAPEETSTKALLFYTAVFFWAFSAIGFGKMCLR
jgi:hypothetical protein